MFLGFMVLQRRVEANLENIQAILEMMPPKNIKEIQSLNGKVTTFSRFISKATKKCLPFFKTLKKSSEWIDECQKPFKELKAYLMSPLLLSLSKLDEGLSLYLVVSPTTISSALI